MSMHKQLTYSNFISLSCSLFTEKIQQYKYVEYKTIQNVFDEVFNEIMIRYNIDFNNDILKYLKDTKLYTKILVMGFNETIVTENKNITTRRKAMFPVPNIESDDSIIDITEAVIYIELFSNEPKESYAGLNVLFIYKYLNRTLIEYKTDRLSIKNNKFIIDDNNYDDTLFEKHIYDIYHSWLISTYKTLYKDAYADYLMLIANQYLRNKLLFKSDSSHLYFRYICNRKLLKHFIKAIILLNSKYHQYNTERQIDIINKEIEELANKEYRYYEWYK